MTKKVWRRVWKHEPGVPVCEDCDDTVVANWRTIRDYWISVDHAIESAKLGEGSGYRRLPYREPVEERCEGGPHECLTCGVDTKEMDGPVWVVQTSEEAEPGCEPRGWALECFCSDSCMEGEWGTETVDEMVKDAIEVGRVR